MTTPALEKSAPKAEKTTTKQSTGWSIPWGMIIAAVVVVALLYFGLPMWKNSKASSTPAPVMTTTTAATVPPARVIRDGIQESLKKEYGTINRTVDMKAPPKVTWEQSGIDPNLRFPIDEYGDLILGGQSKPPTVIDAEIGYKWVQIDNPEKAPARWKGAVLDTGRVWGIIPAVL